MKMVIVPDYIRTAINAKLDEQIAKVPDAYKERDDLYKQLLAHYDEHGFIPEFQIERRDDK